MNSPSTVSSLGLVPADRFFLCDVVLDPAAGAAGQVELALEESSPFPLAQVFHGFVKDTTGQRALGFATYRRRIPVEEQGEWAEAAAVVPDFLALFGLPPDRPLIVLHAHDRGLNGVAWDGQSGLPVAIMSQAVTEPGETHFETMAAELRGRANLGEVEVQRHTGPIEAGLDEAGDAIFRIEGRETGRLPAAALAQADIRDKSFLDTKRREDSRRRGWGRLFVAAVALLLLATGLELVAGGLDLWQRRQRTLVTAQAADVRRIETAQTVASRVEDLAARTERPLEWLAELSAARPRSVQFLRMTSNNDRTLEIEAQTAEAAAVGSYEAALRQLAGLERVEMRDLRSREGITTFVIEAKFKTRAPVAAGGQP